jgi:hypothetical protein
MSDIRERLGCELLHLRNHSLYNGRCRECGAEAKYESRHRADVLLSLPGIAIVELPEPDYFTHWDIPACGEFNGMESTGDSIVAVDITEDGIEPQAFGELTPLETRLFAAALLAAADQAEGSQKETA